MSEPISTYLALAALTISATTAYLTLFRRGTIKMTKPSVVYFGPDGGKNEEPILIPKIFLRSLIYSTGKRGLIIETMFATLSRGETRQTFNIWVYGDDKLLRGSGLHVGETGVVFNHHFLLPADGTDFVFLAGEYQCDIYATIVGRNKVLHLSSTRLTLPEKFEPQLKGLSRGVYFDWGPDAQKYHAKSG